MLKLTVLYGSPTDPVAFEHYYANTHLALAAKIPNTRRIEASKVVDAEAPYHRIAELWFDSTLGYVAAFTFRLGYARGLSFGGIDKVYFVAAVPY